MGNIFSNAMHQLPTWSAGEYAEVKGPWTTDDDYAGMAVADDTHPVLVERLSQETHAEDWRALRAELRRMCPSGMVDVGERALVISRHVVTLGDGFDSEGSAERTEVTETEIVYGATPLRAAGVIDYYGWTTEALEGFRLGVDVRAAVQYYSDARSTDDYSVNQTESYSYRLMGFSTLQRRAVSGFLVAGLRMRNMHIPTSLA